MPITKEIALNATRIRLLHMIVLHVPIYYPCMDYVGGALGSCLLYTIKMMHLYGQIIDQNGFSDQNITYDFIRTKSNALNMKKLLSQSSSLSGPG